MQKRYYSYGGVYGSGTHIFAADDESFEEYRYGQPFYKFDRNTGVLTFFHNLQTLNSVTIEKVLKNLREKLCFNASLKRRGDNLCIAYGGRFRSTLRDVLNIKLWPKDAKRVNRALVLLEERLLKSRRAFFAMEDFLIKDGAILKDKTAK